MSERKDQVNVEPILRLLERHWKWVTVLAWVILCAWFVYNRWSQIHSFDLLDTDDRRADTAAFADPGIIR